MDNNTFWAIFWACVFGYFSIKAVVYGIVNYKHGSQSNGEENGD